MARINLTDSNSKLNVSRERESAMEFIGGRHTEFYRRGIHLFRPARFVNVERRLRWNEPHLILTQRLAKNQERNSLSFFFLFLFRVSLCSPCYRHLCYFTEVSSILRRNQRLSREIQIICRFLQFVRYISHNRPSQVMSMTVKFHICTLSSLHV